MLAPPLPCRDGDYPHNVSRQYFNIYLPSASSSMADFVTKLRGLKITCEEWNIHWSVLDAYIRYTTYPMNACGSQINFRMHHGTRGNMFYWWKCDFYTTDVEFPVQNRGVQKICYTARVCSQCTSGMYESSWTGQSLPWRQTGQRFYCIMTRPIVT